MSNAEMLSCLPCHAGRLTHFHASIGSLLCVLAFLYAFWYVGKAWPGVAAAGGSFFSMKQVSDISGLKPMLFISLTYCCLDNHCSYFPWFSASAAPPDLGLQQSTRGKPVLLHQTYSSPVFVPSRMVCLESVRLLLTRCLGAADHKQGWHSGCLAHRSSVWIWYSKPAILLLVSVHPAY